MRLWLKGCLLVTVSIYPFAYVNADESAIDVVIQEDTLFFRGTLTPESVDYTKTLFERATRKPNKLNITSDGGDVEIGMELGSWLFNEQLDVQVDEYCLSSCANYVFPAANKKYLGNRAIIGFHGGVSSEVFDFSEFDEIYADLPDEERIKEEKKLKDMMNSYFSEVRKLERDFYKMIGVNQHINTLGQSEKYREYQDDYVGWTYRPEDFVKFGVRDVMVINPPWVKTDYQVNKKIFVVDVE